MVAVPGRSKGCHTCRKKRIKCGMPCFFARCSKAGYTCAGYERPLEFRHASAAQFRASTKFVGLAGRNRPRPANLTVVPRPRPVSPPPEISLVAFRDNMCSAFLVANFVWRSYGTPWLELAAKGELGQLSLDASQALAQTNFGTAHHHEATKLDGMIQYSKMLNVQALQLSDPTKPGMEKLIFPVMMLLIQASSQADRHGSESHMKGLTQLLYMCGPQRFQNEPLRHAYESCRATLLTVGLITRQRSLLEQQSWRTVPWALNPSAQSAQSRLVNILSFVPGFLEDDTRLDQDFDFELHQRLVQSLYFQLEQLFEWRWKWEEDNLNTAWEEESPQEVSFGRAIRFRTLTQAVEIMTYNAVLMWILGILWKLDPVNIHSAALHITLQTQTPLSSQTPHSEPTIPSRRSHPTQRHRRGNMPLVRFPDPEHQNQRSLLALLPDADRAGVERSRRRGKMAESHYSGFGNILRDQGISDETECVRIRVLRHPAASKMIESN